MKKRHSQRITTVEVADLLTLSTIPVPTGGLRRILDTRAETHPLLPTSPLGEPLTVIRIHKLSAAQTMMGRAADGLEKPVFHASMPVQPSSRFTYCGRIRPREDTYWTVSTYVIDLTFDV